MHRCVRIAAALVLAISFGLVARVANATDVITFTSTPGSWIGQGQSLALSPVSAHRTFDLGAYTNTVEFSAGGYDLDLVGPSNTLVGVGSYDNVYRWPFNGNLPGMWFTAPGRGDNNVSGWFNVLQADYNSDGTINAFAADFKQYDETSTTNWTQGSVRYNSSIPLPEPASLAAALIAAAPMLGRRTRRRAPNQSSSARRSLSGDVGTAIKPASSMRSCR